MRRSDPATSARLEAAHGGKHRAIAFWLFALLWERPLFRRGGTYSETKF